MLNGIESTDDSSPPQLPSQLSLRPDGVAIDFASETKPFKSDATGTVVIDKLTPSSDRVAMKWSFYYSGDQSWCVKDLDVNASVAIDSIQFLVDSDRKSHFGFI